MGKTLISNDERGLMWAKIPELTPKEEFIEGKKLITLKEAIEEGKKSLRPNDPGLLVGIAQILKILANNPMTVAQNESPFPATHTA